MTIQFRELNGQAQKTQWRVVDLGEAGSFEVELRRPTWGELAIENEQRQGYIETRLRTCLVGWRGVEANGQPVPFSWEKFVQFCEACPVLLLVVSNVVADLYQGLGEETEKNSGQPSLER